MAAPKLVAGWGIGGSGESAWLAGGRRETAHEAKRKRWMGFMKRRRMREERSQKFSRGCWVRMAMDCGERAKEIRSMTAGRASAAIEEKGGAAQSQNGRGRLGHGVVLDREALTIRAHAHGKAAVEGVQKVGGVDFESTRIETRDDIA